MVGANIVDIGENYELVNGKFVFFPSQAVEPTGGDMVGSIAPFPGKAETSFFDLSQ